MVEQHRGAVSQKAAKGNKMSTESLSSWKAEPMMICMKQMKRAP